jgi:hypothetical protein
MESSRDIEPEQSPKIREFGNQRAAKPLRERGFNSARKACFAQDHRQRLI